jgi:TetR/AcrR family transcriptional repressor of mexJK operon
VKQEIILEAAIKRFSHFGINKTTLTEIADDLALSKQSLCYYFSDKQSLIVAVEERIVTEYIERLEEAIRNQPTTEAALLKMVEVKMFFFEKYYRLALQVHNADEGAQGKIASVKRELMEKELNLLSGLFEKGMKSKELNPVDAKKTSILLIDTLLAFAHCVKEKAVIPEHTDFKKVLSKQKDVVSLFYNGLKNQAWSN